jgi:tyrosyl-tRNA synthetase
MHPLLTELETRGFLHQATNLTTLSEHLEAGVPLYVYAGFDCTADSLHVGNLMTLMMLRCFQRHGVKIIPLIGTATTLVGDPSGKDTSRPVIDHQTVEQFSLGIMESVHRVLGETEHRVMNHEWISGIHWINLLREIGPVVSVNRMLTLDSVNNRLNREGGHLSFLEFNYSIMQAYDFLTLTRRFGPMVQIGGSDQWGNITMGSDLISRLEPGLKAWGITHPLLTTPDGKKMGKSEAGTAVWLNPSKLSHFEFWQYWRNVPDQMVGRLLRLFTEIPVSRIEMEVEVMEINEQKEILANAVTIIVRDMAAAIEASETATKLFRGGGVPETMDEYKVQIGDTLVDVLVRSGLCGSKNDARRQITQGSIRINGQQIVSDDHIEKPLGDIVVSRGKKHFRKLVF